MRTPWKPPEEARMIEMDKAGIRAAAIAAALNAEFHAKAERRNAAAIYSRLNLLRNSAPPSRNGTHTVLVELPEGATLPIKTRRPLSQVFAFLLEEGSP